MLFDLIQKYFQMEILSFMIQKKLEDPQVSDSQKVISNGSMDFNDPKELDDPKGISIKSMDFDNPNKCLR